MTYAARDRFPATDTLDAYAGVGPAAPGKHSLTSQLAASGPAPQAGGPATAPLPPGQPLSSLFGGSRNVIQRKEKAADAKPAGGLNAVDAALVAPDPDYRNVWEALSAMNMLAMVHKLEAHRAKLGELLAKLTDPAPASSRIRAAIHAVQHKATPDPAQLKQVLGELDAAKVAIWERVDIAVYLEGSAGAMRKQVLDELAKDIDGRIAALHDVEILKPSAPTATELADRAKLAKQRDDILRLIHDYLRLVDAELVVATGAELANRTEQKRRFDHFKMMRESEQLAETMYATTSPATLAAAKARKYELDALLADGKTAPGRKPVGTSGLHAGKPYVVYEDSIKLGGSWAWVNNNPGNMIASSLATNFKNPHAGNFAVFPTLDLGFKAIPMEIKSWLAKSPGTYTLLRACAQWANRGEDNPAGYAAAVADELNKAGIKAKGAKITTSTLLDDLTAGDLVRMGELMAHRVEILTPGTTYYRSDAAAQPWIAPLLGAP